MNKTEVRNLMGKPNKMKKIAVYSITGEVWTYGYPPGFISFSPSVRQEGSSV
jgi:hypothetical protein